jgi:hypothetical protein
VVKVQLHSTGAASRLDCVAARSNTAGIFPRRALPDGCIAGLGATPDLHHGLLHAGRQELKLLTASASESNVSKTVNSLVIASRSVMRFVRLTSLSVPP